MKQLWNIFMGIALILNDTIYIHTWSTLRGELTITFPMHYNRGSINEEDYINFFMD